MLDCSSWTGTICRFLPDEAVSARMLFGSPRPFLGAKHNVEATFCADLLEYVREYSHELQHSRSRFAGIIGGFWRHNRLLAFAS